jgi:predicted SAM-dependent methyltransferase
MRLHIGGEKIKEGWKILNIKKMPGVDFIGDITDLSQFDDESLEEVYASHVLEHVGITKIKSTFEGIYRVLKKGGKFYISVPNLDTLAQLFVKTPDAKTKKDIMAMIYGGQTDSYDFHYSGYWPTFLFAILENAKFKKYEQVEFFNIFNDTSSLTAQTLNGPIPISLNVIAYKDYFSLL